MRILLTYLLNRELSVCGVFYWSRGIFSDVTSDCFQVPVEFQELKALPA